MLTRSPSRIRRRRARRAFGIAVAVPLLALSIGVPTASAGWACDTLGWCGEASNQTDRTMVVAELGGGPDQCSVVDGGGPPVRMACRKHVVAPGGRAGDGTGGPMDVDAATFPTTRWEWNTFNGYPYTWRAMAAGVFLKITDLQLIHCEGRVPRTPYCFVG